MKKINPIQAKLLDILKDEMFHSGTNLGKQLGLSRTAIWKHLKILTHLGVSIETRSNIGYRLTDSFSLIDSNSVLAQLAFENLENMFELFFFANIPSTNHFLKELPLSSKVLVCVSEAQTAGRGRFGRNWFSPFGQNLYCSVKIPFYSDLSKLAGLSLVTSLAILSAIRTFKISDLHVKWPNDLYWKQKKLSGCLIEIHAESNGLASVIIGFGVNVNSDPQKKTPIDRPWSSLKEITGQSLDRNILLGTILLHLYRYIQIFKDTGFSHFREEWEKNDCLIGNKIQVSNPAGYLEGIALGVNDFGQLRLQTESSGLQELSSGDTSLKAFTSE